MKIDKFHYRKLLPIYLMLKKAIAFLSIFLFVFWASIVTATLKVSVTILKNSCNINKKETPL
jgi:hypothetical protein